MNKRQKEVIQSQLKAEKKILKQLEKQYTAALNDINTKIRILQSDELTQSRIYRIEHQKDLKSQVSGILEKLHSDEYSTIDQFLKDSYTSGFIGTVYDLFGQGVSLILPIDPKEAVRAVMTDSKISGGLYSALGVDVKKLKKSISAEISRGLASDMSYEDITRNIANATKAPYSRARTIVLTETHRIKQASTRDVQVKAKEKGADVLKQWNSTLDGETRKIHRKLDGQIREVEEPFEMDGKKAMYPGDFNDPAEDCNCRCESLTRARWALGEEELATLKERAEFFGLDKTKDFEDFKGKYLKAADEIKKNEDRQAEIRARRAAYKEREAAKKKNAPALNVYGKEIVFDEKMNKDRWENGKRIIKDLAAEYDTRLVKVLPGSVKSAGTFNTAGEMLLSSVMPDTVIHEFAHSIATESYTKLKIADDSAFWKEIKAVKRAYRKDVGDDTSRWISRYEHATNNNDEFLAEAFTYAKMLEKGYELPEHYGNDATYPMKVLAIVDKYFKKK